MSNNFEQFQTNVKRIQEVQREQEGIMRSVMAQCTHTIPVGKKGKLETKLFLVDQRANIYECEVCRQRFSATEIDIPELERSVEVVHNAIQQIRMLSNSKDDLTYVTNLGAADFHVSKLIKTYPRLLNTYRNQDNKKKNGRKNNNGFGQVNY